MYISKPVHERGNEKIKFFFPIPSSFFFARFFPTVFAVSINFFFLASFSQTTCQRRRWFSSGKVRKGRRDRLRRPSGGRAAGGSPPRPRQGSGRGVVPHSGPMGMLWVGKAPAPSHSREHGHSIFWFWTACPSFMPNCRSLATF